MKKRSPRTPAAPKKPAGRAARESPTHKLWGGRFAAGPAAGFSALNDSIGVDFRLWPHDIRGSTAWALGLSRGGVITNAEFTRIAAGLKAVGRRLEAGEQPVAGDEDIHTMVDRLLHEEVGEVASKLHTGRSRNDQVATATRLWVIDACATLDRTVRELQSVLLERAREVEKAIMPGYTHLQRAIPVSAAHWLLSHFWPLARDRGRLRVAAENASALPLGSGALAGSAYPVSRALLAETLGFRALMPNSMDAVGCLILNRWVPPHVVMDHRISAN